jgi:hypothetical protein
MEIDLPDEIWGEVANHLTPFDLVNLTMVLCSDLTERATRILNPIMAALVPKTWMTTQFIESLVSFGIFPRFLPFV